MSPIFKKNKSGYKDYVEDYGRNSNMKLIYVLTGLTLLTVVLIVLLVMFLGNSFDNGPGNNTHTMNNNTPTDGNTATPDDSGNSTSEPTDSAEPPSTGSTVSLSIPVDAAQIPQGSAPTFTMGIGEKAGYVIIDNSLKNKGDLILVNDTDKTLDATYSLFSSVNAFNEARLSDINYPLRVLNTSILLERRVLWAMIEMFKGAEESGGFTLYELHKGYVSDEEVPDFRTGLSINIGFDRKGEGRPQGNFWELPQGQWMMENSYLYGFVRRYTPEKTAITGQSGSSVNYRYVGFPHSYIMKANNLALEEYHDYVRRDALNEPIKVNKNEKLSYEIMYAFIIDQELKTECKLSDEAFEAYTQGKAKITVSGDNFAGFIVTVIYD